MLSTFLVTICAIYSQEREWPEIEKIFSKKGLDNMLDTDNCTLLMEDPVLLHQGIF